MGETGTALLAAGYRVITYDRRGFGASSRPSVGYDYDTLAADLAAPLDALDLREAVLVGFCASTGDVIRYLGTHGSGRIRASFHVAIGASAAAVCGGATVWLEDFRPDLARITVPVLVVQGARDRIVPPKATGDRLPGLLNRVRHVVVPDGPHAIVWTHADQVNRALLDFLGTR